MFFQKLNLWSAENRDYKAYNGYENWKLFFLINEIIRNEHLLGLIM